MAVTHGATLSCSRRVARSICVMSDRPGNVGGELAMYGLSKIKPSRGLHDEAGEERA